MQKNTFERCESEIRSYCRSFPAVFERGKGAYLYDESGKEYLDFFAGAGTLNYGHNNPGIKEAVIDYVQQDGVIHALDMYTVAKRAFLEAFESFILKPRDLDYKLQFAGPTGTNAIEAALKLARKVKKRSNVVAFTNAYHGLTLGSLALTGNRHFRGEEFVNRHDAAFFPFDGYFGQEVDTVAYLRRYLEDSSSGLDIPAAVILETVQAEGGVNVASGEWLRNLADLCHEFDILLIVDDIQVGNGRTGRFFSFEHAGIKPDMVVLSKAIGGFGLPMSLVLIRPELDQWKPAEHTGTFRGNNLAFVAAGHAINCYWQDRKFQDDIEQKGTRLREMLEEIRNAEPKLHAKVRGRGLIQGLEMPAPGLAKLVSQGAFKRRLIIELAGPDDQVLKFLPSLTIEDKALEHGVAIVREALAEALESQSSAAPHSD